MLEVRLTADPKRIVALRAGIAQECQRAKADPEHAALVATIAEQLIVGENAASGRRSRRSEVFVVVTVQSDATMLMVRGAEPLDAQLDERRHRLLDEHAACWSTISGGGGRTIWADISRATPAVSEPAPVATPAPAPAHAPDPTSCPPSLPAPDRIETATGCHPLLARHPISTGSP